MKNYLYKRFHSFGFAVSGLKAAFKREVHFRQHVITGLIVITAGLFLPLSTAEWCVLLACIAVVLFAELVNSALEQMCNMIEPGQHQTIRYVKDISAGAVLIICIFAAAAGLLVFIPHLIRIFG